MRTRFSDVLARLKPPPSTGVAKPPPGPRSPVIRPSVAAGTTDTQVALPTLSVMSALRPPTLMPVSGSPETNTGESGLIPFPSALLAERDKEAENTPDTGTTASGAPPDKAGGKSEPDRKRKDKERKDKERKKSANAAGKARKPRPDTLLLDTDVLGNGDCTPGSKRGVETMFRNVFRAELDLITLAATKANIMISLNGLIMSALMISGAFIHAASPQFFVPVGIFMFTAAASIVFALLAASPERSTLPHAFWSWLKDVFRRKARLRDFRKRVIHQKEHFVADEANILIFKDRVKLSRQEYLEQMFETINSRQLIYARMSEQLYWLGLMADQKFKHLNMSYSIFRWGLLASVVAFLGIRFLPGAAQGNNGEGADQIAGGFWLSAVPALFQSGPAAEGFKGVYEPSSVQQLDDGRILIVEDEAKRALSLLTVGSDGKLLENEQADKTLVDSIGRKLNDMEGLTRDEAGNLYGITSHSTNRQGERNPNREVLMQFRIAGNTVQNPRFHTGLVDALRTSEALQELIRIRAGERADFSKTNIEGMAYDPGNRHLLLGFREPLVNGKTLVLAIGNPQDMFAKNASPRFTDVYLLDLKGGGIRGMAYDAAGKRFLLTNEVRDAGGKNRSHLWSWKPGAEAAVALPVPALRQMKNVEGVGTIRINGKAAYLFTSDDGDEATGKAGKYLKIDQEALPP